MTAYIITGATNTATTSTSTSTFTFSSGATNVAYFSGATLVVPQNQPNPQADRVQANKFMQGSDLLEDFMEFLQDKGFKKTQALDNVTLRHFIEWMVIEAARADGDQVPDYYPTEKKLETGLRLLAYRINRPALTMEDYNKNKDCVTTPDLEHLRIK